MFSDAALVAGRNFFFFFDDDDDDQVTNNPSIFSGGLFRVGPPFDLMVVFPFIGRLSNQPYNSAETLDVLVDFWPSCQKLSVGRPTLELTR